MEPNTTEKNADITSAGCSNGTDNSHVKSTHRDHRHPTLGRPKSLNLIALGPTSSDFQTANCEYDPIVPRADETWTCNKGFRTLRADMVFILDDLIGERRRSERYYQDICALDIPVMTSIIDRDVGREYKAVDLHPFPIDKIIDFYGFRFLVNRDRFQHIWGAPAVLASPGLADAPGSLDLKPGNITQCTQREKIEPLLVTPYTEKEVRQAGLEIAGYLKNSVPMMLAYAGFIGIREISLFGADYDFPGQAIHEADKANCEYWVAILRGMLGVKIRVSSRTTLLSTNQGSGIYGYGARQPVLR